jgi:hypothetical protein
MTPDERMSLAREGLERWLQDCEELVTPIDGALNDLNGQIWSLEFVAKGECFLPERGYVPNSEIPNRHCWQCVTTETAELRKAFEVLWNFWEGRA